MRITLPSGTPAELAVPFGEAVPAAGTTPSLGLALAPDVAGLRPLFDDLCARLANEQGWVVCAPEPFPDGPSSVEDRLASVRTLDDGRVLADLAAAADRTGCARTAVLGFCMGGMYALKASASGRFDRAVSFYGMIRVPEAWRGPGHAEPLDHLSGQHCPVLEFVGGHDHWTPPADVDALAAVEGVEVVRYPDADHGFVHDPSRPAHRPDDAADAWRRAIAFLAGP